MIELREPAEIRAWSRGERAAGRTVALVATMGYLHEAHLRLVDRARAAADRVAMSVFVNPLQFGPQEDFARYPRDLGHDRAAARRRGVDCLFTPDERGMYPMPPVIGLDPGPLAAHLCGPRRPGHFAGVLVIVAKLLHMVEPDVALFGRKDVQQALIIRRMVADLDFPTRIEIAPTVREQDGLAMSSRNVHLGEGERRRAPALARGLDAAHEAFRRGERDPAPLVAAVRRVMEAAGGIDVEYVELVDPEALAPVARAAPDSLLAAAVRVGGTRLIDNIVLGEGIAHDPRADA